MIDYYKVLGLERSSDIDAVKKAYRKNALKTHPERNTETDAKDAFTRISEAYEVLSDSKRRAIYDQYGENGLKNGVVGSEGFEAGFKYHGIPQETFNQFFGGNNPFSELFSATIASPAPQFGQGFGGMAGMSVSGNSRGKQAYDVKQDEPVERDLLLSLEELYSGVMKKVKVSRKILGEDGSTTTTHEKVLAIEIKRGYKAGTKITFSKEGDQGPNKIPADLVFLVKEQPHSVFSRSGNDLIHNVEIPLLDALTGTIIQLTTLDNRVLKIPVSDIVNPQFVKSIPGEGMPLSKEPEKKGNLILKFFLKFPTYLNDKQKRLLKSAFENESVASS